MRKRKNQRKIQTITLITFQKCPSFGRIGTPDGGEAVTSCRFLCWLIPPKRSSSSQAAARMLDPDTPAGSRRWSDIDFNRRQVNQSVKCSDSDCIPASDSSLDKVPSL